jgi:hypothetical protein
MVWAGLFTCYFEGVMHLQNVIPINLHRAVDDGCHLFSIVDAGLYEEAKAHRWLTAGTSNHVIRSTYSQEKGKSVPESLARFVWKRSRVTPPPALIAHVNGDLLDCRNDNLKAIEYPSLARSQKTGSCVKLFMEQNGFVSAAALRTAIGIPLDGVSARRGRQPSVSEDKVRQLLDERVGVANDMSLKDFNAEVCTEILGEPLSSLLLSKIIHGKVSRIAGYDYSKVKPFRRR